jgi:hypothetical protein
MTKEQIINVCQLYDDILTKDGFQNVQENDEYGSLNHARWMLNQIPNMLGDFYKIEKANRWLGFVQGVLWANGYCDIKSMKEHNKPIVDETIGDKKTFMMYGD